MRDGGPAMDRIVLMGPSGAGKSVIGRSLADRLGLPFTDADDLHPEENLAKMRAGTPLEDADRMPWLDRVAEVLHGSPQGGVVACSALALRYRRRLAAGVSGLVFVHLDVPAEELEKRMRERAHFMPPSLLASQLRTLEPLGPDENGFRVRNTGAIEDVLDRIVASLPRG
ncbi:gluconokinase [Microbacterium caowuchunii]|uniref:gluconokinase n=1 Tax=Microbacterium caowuchunii TaxID=2614638 RepID=UPI001EE94807|nr:gluconokinase, GntK/IdnK-type [Microbacterium caowuchunii]